MLVVLLRVQESVKDIFPAHIPFKSELCENRPLSVNVKLGLKVAELVREVFVCQKEEIILAPRIDHDDAINTGMRIDLHKYGIKVSSINPGLVQTEFSEVRFKGDNDRAENVYKGYQPLQAEDIASLVGYMVKLPEHVNLADILILPQDQASSTLVNKK